MTQPIPARIGRYDVVQELGAGGFGTVYRAVDSQLERDVALKVLHPQLAADVEMVARFKREARALARLSHPNIVTIYSVEEHLSAPMIVMELVKGHTLESQLEERVFSLVEALHVLRQVAAALDAAHEEGLVHRDVKPSNVLLNEKGQVKLTDFGIAKMNSATETKLTATFMTLGTALYMAPEQADVDYVGEIGPSADIYALGVVAYQLLAGRVPFEGNTHAVLLAHHVKEPPDPRTFGARIPAEAVRVLRRALAKAPAERYTSAGEFIEALAEACQLPFQPQRAVTPPPTRKEKTVPYERRSASDMPTRQWNTPPESRPPTQPRSVESRPSPPTRRHETPPPTRRHQTPPPTRRHQTPPPTRRHETPPPTRRHQTPSEWSFPERAASPPPPPPAPAPRRRETPPPVPRRRETPPPLPPRQVAPPVVQPAPRPEPVYTPPAPPPRQEVVVRVEPSRGRSRLGGCLSFTRLLMLVVLVVVGVTLYTRLSTLEVNIPPTLTDPFGPINERVTTWWDTEFLPWWEGFKESATFDPSEVEIPLPTIEIEPGEVLATLFPETTEEGAPATEAIPPSEEVLPTEEVIISEEPTPVVEGVPVSEEPTPVPASEEPTPVPVVEEVPTDAPATPPVSFQGTFIGPDFSQGCPGYYIMGYVYDQNGNPLPGIQVRVYNEFQQITPATTKEEPVGWYDIVISEVEATWFVEVIDSNGTPLSAPVEVYNTGNYVEGSEGCRHRVDFKRVE